MDRRIDIERTLIIGDAKVSQGTEAFIKYFDPEEKPYGRWMYATCFCLYDLSALFKTTKGECICLYPHEIIKVTDGLKLDLPLEYKNRLLNGEIIPCEIEVADDYEI